MASVDQGASQFRGSSVPFGRTSTTILPVTAPVTYYRFLGWNGTAPVRWVSKTYALAVDGLTNVTVEEQWEVLE